MRRRLAPFRRMQFETLHRIAHSQREHGAVVAAILDGDGDRAARAMLDHMSIVERAVDRMSPPHRAASEETADALVHAEAS